MKRIPVNLKDKQHEDIRKIAFSEKKSMSDVIREAIDEHIKAKKEILNERKGST